MAERLQALTIGPKVPRFPLTNPGRGDPESSEPPILEEGMSTRRTIEAAFSVAMLLVALVLVSCRDSESVSSPTSPGSAIVTGTVVSGETSGGVSAGSGLAGVTVTVVRTGQGTQTDGAGNFTLAGVPAGDQQFQFSRSDIDARGTIRAMSGATVAVDVAISRRSTILITPRGNPILPAETTGTPTGTATPGTPTGTPTRGPRGLRPRGPRPPRPPPQPPMARLSNRSRGSSPPIAAGR